MNVSLLPEAELEATEAALWYDDQRFGLGDDFLDELHTALLQVGTEHTTMSRLESYDGSHDVRRHRLKRFPYLVIFVRRPGEITVVAISHTRRRPLYWLNRID